jgi:hypothetical protein
MLNACTRAGLMGTPVRLGSRIRTLWALPALERFALTLHDTAIQTGSAVPSGSVARWRQRHEFG